jgi:peptidoglycan/LPS O-acetylase OafA/YrhL
MGFYSIWPYFAGMAIILLFANTPLLRWADTPPKTIPARVQTIDGLRGFLALGVVFHHAAIYHHYYLTGKFDLPPSRFYADLGQLSVAIFFMITGYLFWTQMLRAKGRPNLPKLYVGRVFRIIPLYLFLVAVIFLTVGVLTQWQLKEPAATLGKNVAKWLAGGYITGGELNGSVSTLQLGGQTWTLHYEWVFYVSLAVTSFFARNLFLGTLLPVAGLLIAGPLLQFHPDHIFPAAVLMFSAGMTAASAKHAFAAKPFEMPQWILSTGVIGCLALVLLLFDGVYSPLPILILGVAFTALVVFDTTLYGILLTKPAKRLGDVSYGIYLLQGPILFLTFSSATVRSFATASAWAHWTIAIMIALMLVMVATVTHVLIERPGIKAGQRAWARITSMMLKRDLRYQVDHTS